MGSPGDGPHRRDACSAGLTSVSALIVSFNVRNYVLDTLRALYLTTGSDTEAIVIDNASSDGTAKAIQEAFPQARVIALTENVGFGRANNAGFKESHGEFVLLLNPDVMVDENCVDRLATFLAANPEAGAAGPRLVRPDGRPDLAARRAFPSPLAALYRFTGLSRLFPRSSRFNRYNLGAISPETVHEIDAGTAACLLVRRAALDKVGLFDPEFFMYGEDLDLCFRLRKGGWKIFYLPDAVAVHVKGTSTRQATQKMLYEFHRAMWIFHKKHYAPESPAIVNGGIWLAIWARWAAVSLRAWITRSSTVSP